MKALVNLVLLLLVLGSAQTVRSAPLPVSSYATAQNNWQGSKFYNQTVTGGTLSGRVDYAVYDSQSLQNAAETAFVNGIESVMPGMSQYLYVYQVFNNLTDSEASLAYFEIFNLQQTELNIASQNIGAKDDSAGGIAPTESGLEAGGTKVVWNFAGQLLLAGDHSWYLVLSSDTGPVKGDYKVGSSDSDIPAPIPEPATIALLSMGGLFLARRKIRK